MHWLKVTLRILYPWNWICLQKIQEGFTNLLSHFMVSLYRVKLVWLLGIWTSVRNDDFVIKLILIDNNLALFGSFLRLKYVSLSIHIVVALQCPAESVFCRLENCYSSSPLFWYMVSSVFNVHVFLCKVATLIFKVLGVHW